MTLTSFDYFLVDTWEDSGGTVFQNNYCFQRVAGTASALDLANAFNDEIVPDIAELLWDEMTHVNVSVKNRTTTTDFAVLADTTAGSQAGDALPNFLAMSVGWTVSDLAFRNVYKRWGRFTEPQQTDGELTGATITALGLIGAELLNPVVGAAGSYQLSQYRTQVVLGGAREIQDIKPVNSVQSIRLTSQLTRKR